jgi:hypothetical protein
MHYISCKHKETTIIKVEWITEVVDVSVLADVHTLNLSNCNNIADVSLLDEVCKLNLSICQRVVDVSALGHVHDLNLRYNSAVDVSALGRVHTLVAIELLMLAH